MSNDLPLVTFALPGIAGVVRASADDFEVEELPAYLPGGDGSHVYAWIEKRELTTPQAVERLAAAVGVAPADVGYAGMKDRVAVTRQWLSFPPPATPEAVRAAAVDGVRVLAVDRHGNKLRAGHLHGNRFVLRVREVGDARAAAAAAEAVLRALAAAPGAPNWFGEQRFGARGDNAALGRALVLGDRLPGPPPRGRQRRLLVSAFQSELFNDYLRRRIADELYRRALPGDLFKKTATGGLFTSDDPAAEQPRLDAGEIVPTGPMFGHKMRQPTPGSVAAVREQAILDDAGLTLNDFARVRKLAEGTRRPIAVPVDDIAVTPLPPDAVELRFALPAGAYATAIMREVCKAHD